MQPIKWTGHRLEESQQYETTSLIDHDFGFGNFLAEKIARFKVTSSNNRDKALKEFIASPIEEKFFLGQYEDPKTFLQALAGSKVARKRILNDENFSQLHKRINKRTPVIYFYRGVGIRPAQPEYQASQSDRIITDTSMNEVFKGEFDYTLFVVGFDQNTVDRISTLLLSSLYLEGSHYEPNTHINGLAGTLEAEVVEPHLISFDPASTSTTEGRFFATTTMITVRGDVIQGREITPHEVTYQLAEHGRVMR